MSTKNVSFGIDLGTTNSCISMMRAGTSVPKVIPLRNGNTLPSCVMLNEDGTFTVGIDAYNKRFEKSTIYSVKRYMGSDKIIHLESGSCCKDLTPEEISAEILKELVIEASEYVGCDIIKDVTITVPAHFNDAQRRATQTAGRLAGLNVIGIINEPTSAGLLYGIDNAKSNQTIIVYDLGGGTFDVSILKVTKELNSFPMLGINTNGEYNKTAINIIANDGDVHLGGDDIDKNLADYAVEQIAKSTNLITDTVMSIMGEVGYEELQLRIEKAKKNGRGVILYKLKGCEEVQVKLSGDDVNEKCYKPVFDKSYELMTQAMAQAGITHIDHIVLVGGSTKSSVIQKMIMEKFPHINVMNSFEPDLSVALGASISSASTLGINTLATITDVVPMSIGVVVFERDEDNVIRERFDRILKKDTQLPCSDNREYDILNAHSSDMTIRIMQGEGTYNFNNLIEIGKLHIGKDDYVGNKAEILFKCDLNGVLSCAVIIEGKEFNIPINYTANDSKLVEDDGIEMLDKGQRFFYQSHKKKLEKMGASVLQLERFTPGLVQTSISIAKETFDGIVEELKNNK